jgi:predicted Zn finger-like uncharacterized protein
MIIQCEKCKTRFKLDDSRVTESGVRVRCSRCSHTFIVKRDTPEEESDFDVLLQGLGGTEQADTGAESVARVAGDSSEESSVEAELSPPAAEEKQDHSFGERDFATADALEPKEDKGSSVEPFAGFFRTGVALPQFQEHPASPEAEAVDDTGLDSRLDEAFRPYEAAAVSASALEGSVEGEMPAAEEKQELPFDDSGKTEEVPATPRHQEKWPVADSRADETADDELHPLSISSRRKKSPFFPILIGALSLLVAVVGGFYLFQNYAGDLDSLIPGGLKTEASRATIRTLEGSFLVSREAGELFVIRGEVFNSSGKPLSAMRVQGTVYSVNGSVLARRMVYCGNTFSPKELAFRSFSGMEKTMDRQFGDTLANLEIPPGKGIPFAIVFKNVPRDAKNFGAKIVDLSGAPPTGR